MKKIAFILLVFGIQTAIAQKIAYIEVDRILEKMPQHQTATAEIDAQAQQWEEELDSKFSSIESMYNEYVNNESFLSDEMKKQKQDAIIDAEQKAKEYKEEKFGRDGAIYSLQEEKIKPIYDLIYAAAENVAKQESFDYVFEKGKESGWIYTNPQLDLTEKVIQELGL